MVDDIFNQARGAAREAVEQFSSLAGLSSVPQGELRDAMRNMTPDDLDALAEEYGPEQVMQLIRFTYGG